MESCLIFHGIGAWQLRCYCNVRGSNKEHSHGGWKTDNVGDVGHQKNELTTIENERIDCCSRHLPDPMGNQVQLIGPFPEDVFAESSTSDLTIFWYWCSFYQKRCSDGIYLACWWRSKKHFSRFSFASFSLDVYIGITSGQDFVCQWLL